MSAANGGGGGAAPLPATAVQLTAATRAVRRRAPRCIPVAGRVRDLESPRFLCRMSLKSLTKCLYADVSPVNIPLSFHATYRPWPFPPLSSGGVHGSILPSNKALDAFKHVDGARRCSRQLL
jgi:hypothetical protein